MHYTVFYFYKMIKKVNLNNSYRKGEYYYVKEKGFPARYYKVSVTSKQDAVDFYRIRYLEQKRKYDLRKVRAYRSSYDKFLKDKKLSDDEKTKVLYYTDYIDNKRKVSQKTFNKLIRDQNKDSGVISVSRKPITKKNMNYESRKNRFLVISHKPIKNAFSYFVGKWRIKLRIKGRVYESTEYGYCKHLETTAFDKDVLLKISRERAIFSALLKRGYKEGSDNLVIVAQYLDAYYYSYQGYKGVVNDRIINS